ncbi:hypothetical protein ACOMHN_032439 [Nucella lapillus]
MTADVVNGDSGSSCKDRSRKWLSCSNLKHLCCVALYCAVFWAVSHIFGIFSSTSLTEPKPWPVERYGHVLTVVLYFLRYLVVAPLLFSIFNFLGIVCFSVCPPKPRLQRSPLLGPFLCFRVVTRGLFPHLVRENIERNLSVCNNVDLQNFLFEVVTDAPIHLPKTSRVREVVVPSEYHTRRGTLFKARALQYSLEPEVDILSDDDWIIHLDEETMLTEDAVVGIINFVSEGRHHFGQGVITYSKGHIINWLTTLADSVRVGVDYGSLRFTLKVLHKPFFSWKGSFIVANAAAEKSVSFDHGPESSIAEDCFFAVVAFQQGYSFGFVDGEMHEMSTFTLKDYVQQRRRWMRGISLTAWSGQLPLRYKLGPVFMTLSAFFLPFTALNIPLSFLMPIPLSLPLNLVCTFITSTFGFLFILGALKSFSIRRYGMIGCALLAVASLFSSFVILVFEVTASVMAFWCSSMAEFYIVKKELNSHYAPSVV